MVKLLHFAVAAVACPLVVPALARARWPARAPRTAILAWQALGFTWVVSVIGIPLTIGLAPYDRGVLPALRAAGVDLRSGRLSAVLSPPELISVAAGILLVLAVAAAQGASMLTAERRRRRHRALLDLAATAHPTEADVVVVDHPAAAAYCVPGRHRRIVLSVGALHLLTPDQLAAVLAHERAHGRERHHLVLLPFTALRRLLPGSALVGTAAGAVALLVEMRADDHVRRRQPAAALVGALLRLHRCAAPAPPPGALAAADTAVAARVRRLLDADPPPPRTLPALVLTTAATLAATPLSLFLWPS